MRHAKRVVVLEGELSTHNTLPAAADGKQWDDAEESFSPIATGRSERPCSAPTECPYPTALNCLRQITLSQVT